MYAQDNLGPRLFNLLISVQYICGVMYHKINTESIQILNSNIYFVHKLPQNMFITLL